MEKKLHKTQIKILELSKKVDISKLSLGSIGGLINVHHHQIIKHHIEQLKIKGLLDYQGSVDLGQSLIRIRDHSIKLTSEIQSILDYLKVD